MNLSATLTGHQEVEVKIQLESQEDLEKLAKVLGSPKAVHEQENIFFDGIHQELSSQRAVLRFRFFGDKCVLTVKSQARVVDGIMRANEAEGEIDPMKARAAVHNTAAMNDIDSDILRALLDEFKLEPSSLCCLGGFANTRRVFDWNGLTLELDQTKYEFGDTYEVEVETPDPEKFRQQMEALLSSHNIAYKLSDTTKFARFIRAQMAKASAASNPSGAVVAT